VSVDILSKTNETLLNTLSRNKQVFTSNLSHREHSKNQEDGQLSSKDLHNEVMNTTLDINNAVLPGDYSTCSEDGLYEKPGRILNFDLLEFTLDGEPAKMKPYLRQPLDYVMVNSYQWLLLTKWYDCDYQIEIKNKQ
jgi:hypothetical protein